MVLGRNIMLIRLDFVTSFYSLQLLKYLLIYIAEYNWQVSLSGHLFDQFLINEALDIIEAAGGSFHLVKCQVGQSANVMSYSELKVSRSLFQLIFGRANLCLDIREV